MSVVVLAGPPAVGHNTLAEIWCRRRPRSALVDCDDLRAMVQSPPATLGSGEEWHRQYGLSIRNACALARNFDDEGLSVFVLDVVEPEVLPLFRAELAAVSNLTIVLLTARLDVLVQRDTNRDPNPSPGEGLQRWHDRIRLLAAKLEAAAAQYDFRFDNSDLTPAATADALEQLLT